MGKMIRNQIKPTQKLPYLFQNYVDMLDVNLVSGDMLDVNYLSGVAFPGKRWKHNFSSKLTFIFSILYDYHT